MSQKRLKTVNAVKTVKNGLKHSETGQTPSIRSKTGEEKKSVDAPKNN